MSFQIIKDEENNNNNTNPELLTPKGEQENECYSCTECSSDIEILDLDEKNNILSFKCPEHGEKTITIKEYLENMLKNTFLYIKCSICKKQKNEINNNESFKYCFNCKINICHKCIYNHEKNHIFIETNKTNIKCLKHPNNLNKSFCIDCNSHLCEDCLKQRKHMMHKKINIIEIQPTQDEINTMIKLINGYKNKVYNAQIEKKIY